MTNMFCDKCGKILNLSYENEVLFGKCDCGLKKEMKEISQTQKIKEKEEIGKGYLDDKNQLATYPHVCKKCGHEKAQVIEMGVWYSDEAGVVRYKCGKCGCAEQEKDSNS